MLCLYILKIYYVQCTMYMYNNNNCYSSFTVLCCCAKPVLLCTIHYNCNTKQNVVFFIASPELIYVAESEKKSERICLHHKFICILSISLFTIHTFFFFNSFTRPSVMCFVQQLIMRCLDASQSYSMMDVESSIRQAQYQL